MLSFTSLYAYRYYYFYNRYFQMIKKTRRDLFSSVTPDDRSHALDELAQVSAKPSLVHSIDLGV
jgi:hypothetical protein